MPGKGVVLKRKGTKLVLACSALVSSGGLVSMVTGTSASAMSSAPHLSYTGNITMYAQSYTPTVPGLTLPPGTAKLHEFEAAAAAFEKLYPRIKIKFVYSSTMGSDQWYETEAAGGVLPDVTWVQSTTADTTLPKGIFTNLVPYFNKPNPYIPGNTKWSSIMNPKVLAITRSPGGAQYVSDGDWVGTAWYYNENLFAKAGISHAPTTWEQLLSDCNQLNKHGVVCGDMQPVYGWFNAIFTANALGQADLKKLVSYTPNSVGYINGNDQVRGYEAGFFNPAKNPRFTSWWPAVKQLYSTWDPTLLGESQSNALPAGAPTAESVFLAGQAAMTYDGSWLPAEMNQVPKAKRFRIGSFVLTSLKGSSPYATDLQTDQDVGGPSGGFQYAIPTMKADSSMTPAKFAATLDWVRFFSTPRWDQAIVNELGSLVPTFKGTKPLAQNASIEATLDKPYYQLYPFNILSTQASDQTENLFTEYVSGHISFPAAEKQYDQLAQQAVTAYKAANHSS